MSFNYPKSRLVSMDAYQDQIGRPTVLPVYRFRWKDDTSFTPEQRGWLAEGIASMQALGFTIIWITDGSTVDAEVGHWPDDNSVNPEPTPVPGQKCRNAGRFTRVAGGPDLLEFDPPGLHGPLQVVEAGAHECGHFVGLDHLHPTALGSHGGPCIMAKELSEIVFSSDLEKTNFEGSVPPSGPTRADFAEYDRVDHLGLCPVPRRSTSAGVRRTIFPTW